MAWTDDARYATTRGTLKQRVLEPFGIDASVDTELAGKAENFLDDAIKDFNSHLYEFNKRLESGITLVAGTRDYTLTSSTTDTIDSTKLVPYRESLAYLVKTSDSSQDILTYIPWIRFQEYSRNAVFSQSDIPDLYSMRVIDQTGVVSLHPQPNSSVAADYTLTVEYYVRLPLLSALASDAARPYFPEEVESPLVYAAQKRMAIKLFGPGHEDVQAFDALERRALSELLDIDKRHPDQQQRFRVVDFTRRGFNRSGRRSLYIRV